MPRSSVTASCTRARSKAPRNLLPLCDVWSLADSADMILVAEAAGPIKSWTLVSSVQMHRPLPPTFVINNIGRGRSARL